MTLTSVDTLWYTRCPVPTASGIAHLLGWLTDEFAGHGIDLSILQDAPPEIARRHFDHRLPGLIREGGNVPALVARSEGAPTRLIGLTWIEEGQSILTLPSSGIRSAEDLVGARVAVPAWAATKAESFPRAMALHGLDGALRSVGRSLRDVRQVEVAGRVARGTWTTSTWPGVDELESGEVDAIYVKGGRSVEDAARIGAVAAVRLDDLDPQFRVNNGTPRPITVHASLLEEHPELVDAFLRRTLEAADWARDHPREARELIARETGSGEDGIRRAYGDALHVSLEPTLSEERLALLRRQHDFLRQHGFLDASIHLDAWADPRPLRRAREQRGAA